MPNYDVEQLRIMAWAAGVAARAHAERGASSSAALLTTGRPRSLQLCSVSHAGTGAGALLPNRRSVVFVSHRIDDGHTITGH